MSEINDKDLTEIMDKIKSDAEAIEIPEGIKPENMMKRIEEKKAEGYFEESNRLDGKKDKEKKKNKRFWWAGGIATAVTAASLGIIIAGAGLQSSGDRMVLRDFYSSVKEQTEENEAMATLDSYGALRDLLIVNSTKREKGYGNGFFGNTIMIPENEGEDLVDGFGSSKDQMENTDDDTATSEPDYSDTNTRTENVAEADIIKTDGKYIYAITACEGENGLGLSIFSADGENSELLCSISLQDELESVAKSAFEEEYEEGEYFGAERIFYYFDKHELMIYNDKLVIICGLNEYTAVLICDVTDKAEPKITDKLYVQGHYDSCRLTEGYLYLFTERYIDNWRSIDYTANIYTEEKAKELLAPCTSQGKLDSSDVYVTECEDYNTYHMIATVDMENTTEFKQVRAILGEEGSGQIYVSANNIYYITDIYYDMDAYMTEHEVSDGKVVKINNKSEIISLTYKDGQVTPVKRAQIEGSVGDEFAIDEYNGYLRVAVSTASYTVKCVEQEVEYYDGSEWITDTEWVPDYSWEEWKNGSALYVLDENLEVVGSIPQLKENENVYGVRFDGDIAYVVTYEQMDPLFSIDLSDPANPVVLGALKIPGFSTYLHKWDENTLIGIGYNEWGEIKISTFDITDKTDVRETDVCDIEGVYWASALYEHKAAFISPEKNLIGFMDGYGTYMIFSYVDGELTEVISQQLTEKTYYESRGMYIDDYIYIVGQMDGMYIYDLNTYEFIKGVELP